MDPDAALEIAKQRASNTGSKPTSRSTIEISLGEGRCTREVELIWWPALYTSSRYRKLTVRFFVMKISV